MLTEKLGTVQITQLSLKDRLIYRKMSTKKQGLGITIKKKKAT